MWLVGVVVRRYIDILIIIINFPYSTCIRSSFGSSILTSLFIFKMFFRSCSVIFLAAASLLLCSFKKNVFSVFKNKNKNKIRNRNGDF